MIMRVRSRKLHQISFIFVLMAKFSDFDIIVDLRGLDPYSPSGSGSPMQ